MYDPMKPLLLRYQTFPSPPEVFLFSFVHLDSTPFHKVKVKVSHASFGNVMVSSGSFYLFLFLILAFMFRSMCHSF